MKKLLSVLVLTLVLPAFAWAAYIPVDESLWTGSRSVGEGLSASGSWASQGITLKWDISENAGVFTYNYSLVNGSDEYLTGQPSHFIFEVSNPWTGYIRGTDFDGPEYWGESPGNPNMGGTFFGIKLDYAADSYTFSTNRIPVWGDFYSKDGQAGDQGINTAFNTGIGTEPSAAGPFTNWVPVPDTVGVPEPASLILLGLGLVGLGAAARRKINK